MMKNFDWEPGNGCRYHIIYGQLADGRFLLVWLNGYAGGKALRFAGDGCCDDGYLMDKMGIHEADAKALCMFLSTQGVATHYEGIDITGVMATQGNQAEGQ